MTKRFRLFGISPWPPSPNRQHLAHSLGSWWILCERQCSKSLTVHSGQCGGENFVKNCEFIFFARVLEMNVGQQQRWSNSRQHLIWCGRVYTLPSIIHQTLFPFFICTQPQSFTLFALGFGVCSEENLPSSKTVGRFFFVCSGFRFWWIWSIFCLTLGWQGNLHFQQSFAAKLIKCQQYGRRNMQQVSGKWSGFLRANIWKWNWWNFCSLKIKLKI